MSEEVLRARIAARRMAPLVAAMIDGSTEPDDEADVRGGFSLTAADPAHEALAAVQALHTKRIYDGDGYGWEICVEDRQHWPCATIQAIAARLAGADR